MKALLYSVSLCLALLPALFAAPVRAQDTPCDNPVNRLEHTACLEYKFEQAEQTLERVLKAALEAIDQVEGRWPENLAMWKEALQSNQEAWHLFRETECVDLVVAYYGTGNGVGEGIAQCRLDMTKERIRALKERYRLEQEH